MLAAFSILFAVPVVDREVANSGNSEVRRILKKELGKTGGPDYKRGRMDVSRSLKGQQEVR